MPIRQSFDMYECIDKAITKFYGPCNIYIQIHSPDTFGKSCIIVSSKSDRTICMSLPADIQVCQIAMTVFKTFVKAYPIDGIDHSVLFAEYHSIVTNETDVYMKESGKELKGGKYHAN